MRKIRIYFSDYFGCSEEELSAYGALNISLVADLPLFIDPFLIFNSQRPEYQILHARMIEYIGFLQGQASSGLSHDLRKAWYEFNEVRQNWLGYSLTGNAGRGLGPKFARALYSNLGTILKVNPDQPPITKGRHIEKLCLIRSGVGRDNVSDFTTNLIKSFLLEYTEAFTVAHVAPSFRMRFSVAKTAFNYETETWQTRSYELPRLGNDYVLLTPEDMLTKDDVWISQAGLIARFAHIVNAVPNDQLRAQLDRYFRSKLPKKEKGEQATQAEKSEAVMATAEAFPVLLDYYIREREDQGHSAQEESLGKVEATKSVFIEQVKRIAELLEGQGFYKLEETDAYTEALKRVHFLKRWVENNDGYRLFYVHGTALKREADLQLIFRLTWCATPYEVDAEVNNGRGPVDYKISKGCNDKALVEFKLAGSTSLARNLANQVSIYERSNGTKRSIWAIMCYTWQECNKVKTLLKDLGKDRDENFVIIDARNDNKVSASKADGTEAASGD